MASDYSSNQNPILKTSNESTKTVKSNSCRYSTLVQVVTYSSSLTLLPHVLYISGIMNAWFGELFLGIYYNDICNNDEIFTWHQGYVYVETKRLSF